MSQLMREPARKLLNTAYQGVSAQCEETLGNSEVTLF